MVPNVVAKLDKTLRVAFMLNSVKGWPEKCLKAHITKTLAKLASRLMQGQEANQTHGPEDLDLDIQPGDDMAWKGARSEVRRTFRFDNNEQRTKDKEKWDEDLTVSLVEEKESKEDQSKPLEKVTELANKAKEQLDSLQMSLKR